MRVVFLSDTHTRHKSLTSKLPEGDCIVFGGDFMSSGWYESEVHDFIEWLKGLNYKYKIVVAGNHDRFCEAFPSYQIKDMFEKYYDDGVRYVQDEEIEIEGLKIFGTPYQPFFCNWAFNIKDSDELSEIYDKIPEGLDILITHCPPYDILDKSHKPNFHNMTGESPLGSKELKNRLESMEKPPRYHIFGHIHGDGGKTLKVGETTYINASVCDEEYKPVNPIVVLDI